MIESQPKDRVRMSAQLQQPITRYFPILAMLVVTVTFSVVLLVFREPLDRLGDFGYAGAFLIMVVSNATIVLPALGHAFVVATAQTLNPLWLGLVAGLGATLGELTGYVLGRTGHTAAGHYRVVRRLQGYSNRRFFGPVLFVFAASPLPMDVAGIVAGTSRYSVWRFVVWVGAGKILNTVLIATASYYTIDMLQMLFGG